MSSINRWICLLLILPFIAESSVIPQANGRSQPLLGCSAEILRFSECSSRCNDSQNCVAQELSNFMTACMSGNTQNCTEPPIAIRSQPGPPQTTLSPTEPPQTTLSPTEPPETTLSPTEPPQSSVKCGIENRVLKKGRVIGVTVNVARKYSWQVGLKLSSKEGPYNCGGTIITDKHILTSASCFVNYYEDNSCRISIPDKLYVYIGDHNQHAASDNLLDFVEPIEKQYVNIHPDYNCNEKDNDIAVIELNKTIDLEKNADEIHPICLPEDDSRMYTGLTATITGWGSTVGYNLPLPPGIKGKPFNLPNVLQEAQVPVWNNSRCIIKIPKLGDTMMCAASKEGFEKDGTGTCKRDYGGPLSVKENGQHVEIGIISPAHENGCASKGNPNVYTRVSKFINWIKIQVGNETTYTAN